MRIKNKNKNERSCPLLNAVLWEKDYRITTIWEMLTKEYPELSVLATRRMMRNTTNN